MWNDVGKGIILHCIPWAGFSGLLLPTPECVCEYFLADADKNFLNLRSFLSLNNPKRLITRSGCRCWCEIPTGSAFFFLLKWKKTTWQVLELRGTGEICWTQSISNYLMPVLIGLDLSWVQGRRARRWKESQYILQNNLYTGTPANHTRWKYFPPFWFEFISLSNNSNSVISSMWWTSSSSPEIL